MSQHLKGWNKQTPAFTTQTAEGRHPSQKVQEFGPGLRGAALYADLDIAEATGGQFRAHIIKWNQEQIKKNREANNELPRSRATGYRNSAQLQL